MLSDVQLGSRDPGLAMILGVIGTMNGGGDSPAPTRIDTGLYLTTHWSFEDVARGVVDTYPDFDGLETYGVCDSPDQFVRLYGEKLASDPRKLCVSFVKVSRAAQSSEGGWRWHKWGPYVGEQKPTTEYLHDEPDIAEVYTFHVYQVG